MSASESEEIGYYSASEGTGSDVFEDDGTWEGFSHRNDLEDIGSGITVHLGIETLYQPYWKGVEAFREFYQNWKDAIIKSFELEPSTFKTEYQQVSNRKQILIIVRHPTLVQSDGRQKLLGFIRFTWKGSEGCGVLEFVNKNAQLQLRHLGMGGTTKRKDRTQAGYHGEGLTLGALVMRRNPQNYSVRYENQGYSWTFNFNKKRKLYCRVSRMRTRDTLWGRDELQIDRLEDVYLKIGAVRKSRMSHGIIQKTKQIPLGDFQRWLKVTIDIHPPSLVIRTLKGNALILDEEHKGKNYLRGLFLYSEQDDEDAVVGYDFRSGKTDRDRTRFIDSHALEVPDRRTDIWQESIFYGSPSVPEDELLGKYVQLLKQEGEKGGRHLGEGKREEGQEQRAGWVARKVWKHLQRQSDENSEPFLYYCENENPEDEDVITEYLNQTPEALPKYLWSTLRSHDLNCRTPKEEQEHRFNKSDAIITPETSYAQHMMRALQACLALSPLSSATRVEYVREQGLGLDVTYSNKLLRVSDKWLDFEAIHETTECERSRMERTNSWPAEASGVFFCDHAVIDLYALVLDQIPKPEDTQDREYAELKKSMRAIASEKLSQWPRNVRAQPTSQPSEVRVTWDSAESALVAQYSDKQYLIILHDEHTCSQRRLDVLHSQDGPSCDCPRVKVPLGVRGPSLQGLGPNRKYFPMIARDEEMSFYGLAPPPVSPNRPQREGTRSQSTLSAAQEPPLSACPPTSIHGYKAPYVESYYSGRSDVFDTSSPPATALPVDDDDDDNGLVDMPIPPGYTRSPPAPSNPVPSRQMEKLTIGNQITKSVVDRSGFPDAYRWFRTPDRHDAVIGLSSTTSSLFPNRYGSSKDELATPRKRPRTES